MEIGHWKKRMCLSRAISRNSNNENEAPRAVMNGITDPDEPLLEAPGYERHQECYRNDNYEVRSPSYPYNAYSPQSHVQDLSHSYSGVPTSPSPLDYLHSSRSDDYEAANGGFSSQYNADDETGISNLNGMQNPFSSDGHHSSARDEDDVGTHRKGKRVQTCRLCANHDMIVEMKGHKLYCPYQKPHDCPKCEITMLRRHFVAAQQRQTRNQQALQEGYNGLGQEAAAAPLPSSPTSDPQEFPRLQELLTETGNIIDENLFARINEVVRPRSHLPKK